MTSNFSALVENVITCPVCLKHFDEPRMLPCSHTFCFQCIQQMATQNNGLLECPKRDGTTVAENEINTLLPNKAVHDLVKMFDHPDSSSPMCHRCETNVAQHWCDSDCKHCFCSGCWENIHEVGQYRNHTKLPVKDRPAHVPICQEHDEHKAQHWCELCTKEICNNCHQLKHKDHPVILITGDAKPLQDECENGLQGVQMSLNYRSNRTENMLAEIEQESQSNQSNVTAAMTSLRQLIDEREKALLEEIQEVEKEQKKPIEKYKRELQVEQQGLIEQVLDIILVSKDKQPKKREEIKTRFDDYIKRTDTRLLELKPLTRIKRHIPDLDKKMNDVKTQIQNIKLEELKHSNQKLQERIDNNPDKSTLTLDSLKLTDLDMEIVANQLEINKALTTLKLLTNEISDNGAQYLADALRTNKTLTTLNLCGNQIGDNGMEHFADALRTNKTLTNLQLHTNKIGDNGAEYLINALKVNKTLTELNLQSNPIGENTTKQLEDTVTINKAMGGQLREIKLGDAPKYVKRAIPKHVNQQLQQKFTSNPTQTNLNLGSNQLTDQDMEIVAYQLENNETITTLQLQGNKIGDIGAQHLADALKINNTLTTLNLNTNQIGDKGAQHLGDALKINQTLTQLQLQTNKIGDNGAQHLADALKVNKTLTYLHLAQNQIGDQGAKDLSDALKTNQVLTHLYLGQNQITDTGVQNLADALKVNKTLTYLNLYQNQIGDSGAQHLGEALKINKALKDLRLQNNKIGDSGAQHLANALKTNTTLTTFYLPANTISAHVRTALNNQDRRIQFY